MTPKYFRNPKFDIWYFPDIRYLKHYVHATYIHMRIRDMSLITYNFIYAGFFLHVWIVLMDEPHRSLWSTYSKGVMDGKSWVLEVVCPSIKRPKLVPFTKSRSICNCLMDKQMISKIHDVLSTLLGYVDHNEWCGSSMRRIAYGKEIYHI